MVTSPGVVGVGDFCEILIGEFAVYTVNQFSHFAGVDKKRFAAPDAESYILACAGMTAGFVDRNRADGDLRGVEQLSWQGHHAIHQVGLDDGLADFAFA